MATMSLRPELLARSRQGVPRRPEHRQAWVFIKGGLQSEGGCSRRGIVLHSKLVYSTMRMTTPCFHCAPLCGMWKAEYATRIYTPPPINVYSLLSKSCIQYSKWLVYLCRNISCGPRQTPSPRPPSGRLARGPAPPPSTSCEETHIIALYIYIYTHMF